MERKRLGEDSWLYYGGQGALRSDVLGSGVVLHTCRGVLSGDLAQAVVIDGETSLRVSGRCIFMVDNDAATRITKEFRNAVTEWLAVHRDVTIHLLLKSRVLEMAIKLAHLVLRRSPVRLYSNVHEWEVAVAREVPGWRRVPNAFPPSAATPERFPEILPIFQELDEVESLAAKDLLLHTLLDQVRLWALQFARRGFGAAAPDVEDLVADAVQHLLVVVAERRYAEVLVSLLRAAIRDASSGPREVRRRLALLDEFLLEVTVRPRVRGAPDRRTANRLSQRRGRTRRFVREIWERSKGAEAVSPEVRELARALGLEQNDESRARASM